MLSSINSNKNDIEKGYENLIEKNYKLGIELDELKTSFCWIEKELNDQKIENIELLKRIKKLEDSSYDWCKKIEEVKVLRNDNHHFKLLWNLIHKIKELYECPVSFSIITRPIILQSGVTIQESCFNELKRKWKSDPYDKTLKIAKSIPNRFATKVSEIINEAEKDLFTKVTIDSPAQNLSINENINSSENSISSELLTVYEENRIKIEQLYELLMEQWFMNKRLSTQLNETEVKLNITMNSLNSNAGINFTLCFLYTWVLLVKNNRAHLNLFS